MTDNNWYHLRNAVYEQRYSDAQDLIKNRPELISLRNGIGETVLHFLAVENDIRGVKWLYNQGFDINTKNDFGTPVIFEVAHLGYKELLTWLFENKADFKAIDNEGYYIIQYLKDYEVGDMVEFIKKCKMCT